MMRTLTEKEIEAISGGTPLIPIAVVAVVRYAAPKIAAGVATGALGGFTVGYLRGSGG